MELAKQKLKKLSSFKVVLIYAVVSALYVFTSDYLLDFFVKDVDLLSKVQTCKGIGFIGITSVLLYFLVKRNFATASDFFEQTVAVKKASDNQLQSFQEEYMSLFDHSPIPMWIYDPVTFQFLLVNEAACTRYGYTHHDYLSMTVRDIRPEEDAKFFDENYFQMKKEEDYTFSGIVRHKKKSGEHIYVKVKNAVVNFNGKKVRLGSAEDVSAELKIQKDLQETNEKLELASEIAGMGYWTNDLLTGDIQWSTELHRIFEIDPKTFEINFNSIQSLFHPDDQANFDPSVFLNLEEKKISEYERRIITGTGKTKWILERLYLIKDDAGKPVKLEGIALDITSRKIHEQELWESNERFKILANATVEAIIDWDVKNDTVMWGAGFHSILGYDLSLSTKTLWVDNIHPEDRDRVLTDLLKIMKDPTRPYFTAEFRFLKANGDIAFVKHKGVFIRDNNGRVTRALAAMIDLTDTLERLRKIELQNKALRDIAWTQSHIVRAPLANLLGLASLLQENYNNGKSDKVLINHLFESAQKLDTIICDIVRRTDKLEGM